MKRENKSIKYRIMSCVLCMIPFGVLVVITKLFFSDVYLFEWMLRHRYIYLWAIVLIVAIFDRGWGCVIAYSNFAAVFLGEFIGNAVRNYNISKVEPGMSAEKIAYLYLHHGWSIWCGILMGSIIIYASARKIRKRRAETEDV